MRSEQARVKLMPLASWITGLATLPEFETEDLTTGLNRLRLYA